MIPWRSRQVIKMGAACAETKWCQRRSSKTIEKTEVRRWGPSFSEPQQPGRGHSGASGLVENREKKRKSVDGGLRFSAPQQLGRGQSGARGVIEKQRKNGNPLMGAFVLCATIACLGVDKAVPAA